MQNIPHQRHIPGTVIAGIVVLALIPIIGAGTWLWIQWYQLPPLVQSTLRILVFGIPLGGAAAAIYVGIIAAYNRLARLEIVKADRTIALTHAQRDLPGGLTNLSYSFHDSRKALPAPELEQVSAPELAAPIPTFGNLLDAGQIGPGRPMLLGFNADTGQALTGSWNDLYSCGVGGMTGSGKSWAVAFLAGQSAAMGARCILIDPHQGDPESLSNRLAGLSASYMCDVASTPQAIEAALKLAAAKLDNRKAGKGGNWPILLICDEWTSLLRGRLGDLLTATALDIAEQGRKFGVFAILAAQAWQVDAAGAVRDRLASHYVLRTRGDQFRYQTGLRAATAPADTLTLQSGQAYMLSVRGDLQRVVIPQMAPADLLRLGGLIDKPASAAPTFGFHAPTAPLPVVTAEAGGKPLGSGGAQAASTAAPTVKIVSAEATRAAALFKAKMSEKAIVKELRGIDGGRNYEAARNEVRNLILEGLLHENH